MADDRVFIKCKVCGGWKMLLKYVFGRLTTRDNDILSWLDNHQECHRNYTIDLGGNPGYSLHTEDELYDGGDLDPKKQNYVPEYSTVKLVRG